MSRSSGRWLLALWFVMWGVFSVPWTSLTTTANWERARPPRVRTTSRVRPDHVLNVLFYVPLAPVASVVGWSLPGAVATGAAMSLLAEGIQLFSDDRSPDGNDLIANFAGTLGGAFLVFFSRYRS